MNRPRLKTLTGPGCVRVDQNAHAEIDRYLMPPYSGRLGFVGPDGRVTIFLNTSGIKEGKKCSSISRA